MRMLTRLHLEREFRVEHGAHAAKENAKEAAKEAKAVHTQAHLGGCDARAGKVPLMDADAGCNTTSPG